MTRAAPPSRNTARYLLDGDILHAGAVTVLAVLLSLGLVWLAYFIHVWRIAARSPVELPRRMIVLVFGCRLHRDAPGTTYRARLARALQLMRTRQTDHVLLLGGLSGGSLSEAEAGHRWLQQQGLPDGVTVQLETESVDSLQNLRHARRLLRANSADLPPVALLTSRFHLARCLLLAGRLGFDSVPVAAEAPSGAASRRWLRMLGESGYLMWTDLGLRWAHLIGHRRMAERIS